jgi:hypothetical protein
MMDEFEQKNKEYISALEKYADSLRANTFYSTQRIDLLIISVSGAGIYASIEFIKYINSITYLTFPLKSHYIMYFKITGLLFIASIATNFVSQLTSYFANNKNLESVIHEIQDSRSKSEDSKDLIKKRRISAERYNDLTKKINLISPILMILGLVLMVVFIWILL